MPKNKNILIAGLIVFLSLQTALAASYTDVPADHPDYIAIEALTQAGVFGGYEDGTFKPENGVNRAEALKMVFRAAGINPSAGLYSTGFPDVPLDAWYAGYVMEGLMKGIIGGNPDGTFAGERGVNNAEFLKMTLLAFDTDLSKHLNPVSVVAADVPGSAWYTPYLSYAKTIGLVYPDQEYMMYPSKNLTRGECAGILYKMMVILQGGDTQKYLSIAEARMVEAMIMLNMDEEDAAAAFADEAVYYSESAAAAAPESTAVKAVVKISAAFKKLIDAYGIEEEAYADAGEIDAAAAGQVEELLLRAESLAGEAVVINSTSSWLAEKIYTYADTLRARL